ncbi:MAG: hypothetical protein TU35_008555 [Thermoproteus sp. AZ2]|jgi:hypothetical protein|uniref:Uncharacterized protein n=1 Tax=Thermoproteus sp. AZ2 TaxID=1609232 RepID=A0ACC6V2N2_9CREN
MLALLYLIINSTAMAVPIPYIPYAYSLYLGGCANVTAYLDPLSGLGISAVYAISQDGVAVRPPLSPESTPTYASGDICGAFLSIVVDKWRSIGPLIPVSEGNPAVYNLLGEYQLNFTDAAIIEIKSLYKPNITGSFIYKLSENNILGVYVEKYIAYEAPITIQGYGLINITPIYLSQSPAEYYIFVQEPGVNVSGGFPLNIAGLRFSPSQTYLVGNPKVVVSQVQIPVIGNCSGSAYVPDPLTRPITVLVNFDDGESYAVQFPYFPHAINTTTLRGIEATALDGTPLSALNLTTYLVAPGGQPVGQCLIEGLQYQVAVVLGNKTLYYPASINNGVAQAATNIVRPAVVVQGIGYGVASPPIAVEGENITVSVYLNGTLLAKYQAKAEPRIVINDSKLLARVEVVDVFRDPLGDFYVEAGNLTFRGSNGVAYVVPSQFLVVVYGGRQYLVQYSQTITLPVLTKASLIKALAGSLAVGIAAGIGLAPRRKKDKVEAIAVA